MPLTSREMINKLKKYGFVIVSQNGSHIKMVNTDNNRVVIVPYHCKDLKKGNGAGNIETGRNKGGMT